MSGPSLVPVPKSVLMERRRGIYEEYRSGYYAAGVAAGRPGEGVPFGVLYPVTSGSGVAMRALGVRLAYPEDETDENLAMFLGIDGVEAIVTLEDIGEDNPPDGTLLVDLPSFLAEVREIRAPESWSVLARAHQELMAKFAGELAEECEA